MSVVRRRHPVAAWSPSTAVFDPSFTLLGWCDDQISRLQDDLHCFVDLPHVGRFGLDPSRRSQHFDALYSDEAESSQIEFRENPNKNQVECQISTACGNFFRPEDIEVNVKNRNVEFKARREQKSEDGQNYTVREVRRVFQVPESADVDKLHIEMVPNGKIMLTAPLLKPKAIDGKLKEPVPIKINKL